MMNITIFDKKIKIFALDDTDFLQKTNQNNKVVLLYDVVLERLFFFEETLKQCIVNGVEWIFCFGQNIPKIEDILDDFIVDISLQYGDHFLNVVTTSDTDLNKILWDFTHLPDMQNDDVYLFLYDRQNSDEKTLIKQIKYQECFDEKMS